MLKPENFFDLSNWAHKEIFMNLEYVWDALKYLNAYLASAIKSDIQGIVQQGAYLIGDQIRIGKGSIVEPGAYIEGPAIIGEHTVIRHGAYIRGYVLIGDHCVVGHATEMKEAILLDHCHVPHFNYVGDSILGNHVNLGAGTILSNLKITPGSVVVKLGNADYNTGLRKFGAILGDHAQTGCNVVLNPGTLIGTGSLIYPNAPVSGYIPPETVVKFRPALEFVKKR